MSKNVSQSAIRSLIIEEFGEGTFFTKEELWFRYHQKYIYSTRKELENLILNMARQNQVEIKTNQDGKDLISLRLSLKSSTNTHQAGNCNSENGSDESFQADRKALKEIKPNELNLRHLHKH
ncbi:hypothetical protein M9Y10_012556 [Tritrichomonas musculus]|uniref:Uncharacterized protein n=1 Tax=Tritrichomonas musculus TaxID=1915356 RepID=A0ABR2ICU8_9EUKA